MKNKNDEKVSNISKINLNDNKKIEILFNIVNDNNEINEVKGCLFEKKK